MNDKCIEPEDILEYIDLETMAFQNEKGEWVLKESVLNER